MTLCDLTTFDPLKTDPGSGHKLIKCLKSPDWTRLMTLFWTTNCTQVRSLLVCVRTLDWERKLSRRKKVHH